MSINKFKFFPNVDELLIDFGNQPVSNRFLLPGLDAEAPHFPLQLRVSNTTGLVYQGIPFPVNELRPRYDWLTCFEPEDHLDSMVEKIIELPGVTKDSIFGAYSFKDDTTLNRLNKLGFTKTWRLDPLTDLGVTDPCANVETYQAVLTEQKAKNIAKEKGLADILIVRHVIEHSNDISEFIAAMRALTNPNGYIIWELPDCERAFTAGDCTTIWEEHIYYFTTFTFRQLLADVGFEVIYFESIPYEFENSIVAIVKAGYCKQTYHIDTNALVDQIKLARSFATAVANRRISTRSKLENLKKKYGSIVLFGAGHLSVAFLSLMGVADLIDFVIDDNQHKKGMLMPIGKLKIHESDMLYSENVKICLLSLNPQNQSKVIAKHNHFMEQGGIFISIFPNINLDLNNIE